MPLLVQELQEELELIAFVLHSINETALKGALRLTVDDIADFRALLRDDHHGICLIIRLLHRDAGAQRRKARKCRSIDTLLRNRIYVKRVVAEMLNELQVTLSNPRLQTQ